MLEMAVTKSMRAAVNVKRERCAQCGNTPEQVYQFWHTFEGEPELSDRVVRSLPVFCGVACWRSFVNGREWSDRENVRVEAEREV
jgi:hypothetical protein